MKKLNNYSGCIDYLYSLERVGIKYDLKNIRTILNFLCNPEKKFKSIHIAGTNGKGSVASIINSVFIEHGIKTGLYTSPHILDFKERILINGKKISEEFIIDFTKKLYNLVEKINPSFFEVTTALAFEYFAINSVDYAVIEAGLGGRLDSTNVLKPKITIITGIGIDHTEYLGNTIEKIAYEKAGIIKKNIPCVIGNIKGKSLKVISGKCRIKKSVLIKSDDLKKTNIIGRTEKGFEFKTNLLNNKIFYPIVGDYQLLNIKTALSALLILQKFREIKIEPFKLRKGFENLRNNSRFYGRFQKINDKPKIIIDVSHNLQGITNLKNNLKYIKYRKLFIIFGMMKDKEYIKCLNIIEKLNAVIILTKPDYKRAEDPEVLYKNIKNKENVCISENIKSAFNNCLKLSIDRDLILITGSFFLVSDFLKLTHFNFDL